MMNKTVLLCLALVVLLLSAGTAEAATTTVGANVSRGQSDTMAYSLNVSQMYEPWISTGVCELSPLAEIGGHIWVPDDSDYDSVGGGYLGVGLRFTLFTNKMIRPFIEGNVGGAVNTDDEIADRKLGSHALFRTRGSVGINFGDTYSHTLRGDVTHLSTGGLTDKNDGYTTYGVGYGYSF